MRRRSLLTAGAVLAGCRGGGSSRPLQGGWVGTSPERGHRLQGEGLEQALQAARAAPAKRTRVLIAGGGVAGLAAARALRSRGVDDLRLLELEDQAGGNARGHVLAGFACPLGAHYLPLPPHAAAEVRDWLFEIGLLRHELGRTAADERHLCHSPQERLFVDGAWHDGLLPPHADRPATLTAYRRFAAALEAARRDGGGDAAFALPAFRARPGALQRTLDGQTFAAWLDTQGLHDARLRWYLDYCCRDDYGEGLHVVSAWAGLHYFASRHGFAAPGEAGSERDGVFTWPEGNGWLTRRLAAPLGERLLSSRVVLRIGEERESVRVLAWNAATGQGEQWLAARAIVALPLRVAARIVESPPAALTQAAAAQRQAAWLVANLHIGRPLTERLGAPPSWDNVIFGADGLGYVDAMHQSLRPHVGATVLTAYHTLPASRRAELLALPWTHWAEVALRDLEATHPDLRERLVRIELTRHGHAMAVPVPGTLASARDGALAALRAARGRLVFAHADLSGYSVFEEAFTAGHLAGHQAAT